MGHVLSLPMIVAGIAMLAWSLRRAAALSGPAKPR
jgi:prolipoprotein diacylglyceryltransferase